MSGISKRKAILGLGAAAAKNIDAFMHHLDLDEVNRRLEAIPAKAV